MTTRSATSSEVPLLDGRRVAFVGKLGGVNRRTAHQMVREHGAVATDDLSTADLLVVGAEELPVNEPLDQLSQEIRDAAAAGQIEIVSETQLWQRLGLVEPEGEIQRLYTPAMLAELLGVATSVIRRWHRCGLIVPVREVHRLPYFDFQEVATARRLAQLLAAGASPAAVEKKLAELSRFLPDVDRPLAQLSVIVEGKQILLRQGEGLVEPGGQLRIDFDAIEEDDEDHELASIERPDTVSIEDYQTSDDEPATPAEMLAMAIRLEEDGELEAAIELYRATLAAGGPNPEVCFLLADTLYRVGDVTAARERYAMTIELDEDYVEARANLGCVLAETGEAELAVAAFEGALRFHEDYPDVHYHLARTLDDLGRGDEATTHWQRFLELAPGSPWAEEAQQRLAELVY